MSNQTKLLSTLFIILVLGCGDNEKRIVELSDKIAIEEARVEELKTSLIEMNKDRDQLLSVQALSATLGSNDSRFKEKELKMQALVRDIENQKQEFNRLIDEKNNLIKEMKAELSSLR